MSTEKTDIKPADGKLLVLLPGLGAVSTTFIAGVELARQGIEQPVGSLTQLARLDGTDKGIHEQVNLTPLDQIEFAGWDLHGENAAEVAKRSDVLTGKHFAAVEPLLKSIDSMPAVHDPEVVRRLEAKRICKETHRRKQADQLRKDIRDAMAKSGAARAVCVLLTSTEVAQTATKAHSSLKNFEAALDANDPAVTPTQLYAYACLQEGVPFANGTPNLAAELPALQELAREKQVPVAGKDLKTGQTMIKTVIAPALKARMLGVRGWFSTNILGNRDGEVLDDFDAFKSKEMTKRGCLEEILQPDEYPGLYSSLSHKVEINFYPPRGDNKEGWDNIDVFGWMGYPMQLKVDFLCRDSILAAPLALDLCLFMDLANRAGMGGIQEWLSFYFKSPQVAPGLYPEHDLFIQLTKLKNTLRWIMGEEQITHLGIDYYQDDDNG